MSDLLRNYHLPMIYVSIVITIQISVYFLYLYYNKRKEKLELNKILLAFGFVYGFGLTGTLIRLISVIYIEDLIMLEITHIITYFLILLAVVSFEFIISSDAFNEILDTRIAKFMFIITLIVGVLYFILIDLFIMLTLYAVAILSAFLHLLIFHFRLLKNLRGEIQGKFILMTLGEFVIVFSLINIGIIVMFLEPYSVSPITIEAIMFLQPYNEVLLIFLNFLFISGLVIIFLGIYNLPGFLEFGWKENLIKFYVIHQTELKELYSYDFEKKEDKDITNEVRRERDVILSSGIVGIEDIISQITHTDGTKLNKIWKGDVMILLKYGDNLISPIIYILLIRKEMKSIDFGYLQKLVIVFKSFANL